jgi:hypothetical protein
MLTRLTPVSLQEPYDGIYDIPNKYSIWSGTQSNNRTADIVPHGSDIGPPLRRRAEYYWVICPECRTWYPAVHPVTEPKMASAKHRCA